MSVVRRRFSKEFKREAVHQALESDLPMSSVARDLDIRPNLLGRWKQQYLEDPDQAFPGEGRLQPEQEEVRRLRRELAMMKEEHAILKKAVAIFSDRRR